jgi:hypothetical protein
VAPSENSAELRGNPTNRMGDGCQRTCRRLLPQLLEMVGAQELEHL